MTKRKNKEATHYCEVCGNAYNPKVYTSKYCGSACKQKAYRANKALKSNAEKKIKRRPGQVMPHKKVCPHCGKHFTSKRSDAIFCSNSCRVVSNKIKQQMAIYVYAKHAGIRPSEAAWKCEAAGWSTVYDLLQKWGYTWVVHREGFFTEVQLIAQGELL